MNPKHRAFRAKKIPYYLSLVFLTVGASLILGFLSFSGMFALFPFLPLAFASFGLSVAYEGEIYLQNIKGALKKLFKTDYLQQHLGNEFLRLHFPDGDQLANAPEFFKDYAIQLQLLGAFGHHALNPASRLRKKRVEKTLKDMEKWFASQLFPSPFLDIDKEDVSTPYAQALQQWLASNDQAAWQGRMAKRQMVFKAVKAFSVLAGIFMGFGTTYLIVEAFSVIPFFITIPFVFWPVLILPMALIAGAAYGMLTYNAVTDLINNNTVSHWYQKLHNDFVKKGLTIRNVLMATATVVLVVLAIALTVCTAGTWWTVATSARPLFEWMKRIPNFVMGIINPIITGFSAVFFIIQNTAESLEMLYKALQITGRFFRKIPRTIEKSIAGLRLRENGWQIINPIRLLLTLTITPLRVLLFLGHLVSIAVTADRVPGIPQIWAALVAIISEGFEDMHYFMGHDHNHDHNHDQGHGTTTLLMERLNAAHGHNHNMDIPTVILQAMASPLYFLAAGWDFLMSKMNASGGDEHRPYPLSFQEAWDKQRGNSKEKNKDLTKRPERPSQDWQVEHTLSLIERHQNKHLNGTLWGRELIEAKREGLGAVQEAVQLSTADTLGEALERGKAIGAFNRHRLFARTDEKTSTQEFMDGLASRVSSVY